MKVGRLLLRGTVGALFIGHGTQKLFGAFGGNGLEATGAAFESMGLRPGLTQATIAGVTETGGGLGMLLGFQTPLAAAALIGTMTTAIERVHLKNGPWITNGGYEYNVLLIAAAATLAELGPGPLSIDAIRGRQRSGARWALLALTLGAIGAAGAHAVAESQKGAPAPATTTPEPDASEPDASKPAPATGPAPVSSPSAPETEATAPEPPATDGSSPDDDGDASSEPAAQSTAPADEPVTTGE